MKLYCFNKKYSLHAFFLMSSIGWFASCERVIHIDVGNKEQKYVVEALITDAKNSCSVNVSKVTDVYDTTGFRPVSDAVVLIKEDNNLDIPVKLSKAGNYKANFSAKPGHHYTLKVNINGVVYTGSSTMPVKVNMDSVYLFNRTIPQIIQKEINIVFTDPVGLGNTYRITPYVGGKKKKTLYLSDNSTMDGKKVNFVAYIFDEDDLLEADNNTIRVDMQCITPFMQQYWYSLSQESRGKNETASPSNPPSSFNNGALGYFSTQTTQSKTISFP